MKLTSDGFVLSTGREFPANCHLLGINDTLEITEGYDDVIDEACDHAYLNDDLNPFTPEERREVADYVISLWNEWADTVYIGEEN